MASVLIGMAQMYVLQQRYLEAEALDKRALTISEKVFGSESMQSVAALGGLCAVYFAQHRYAEADEFSQRALAITEKLQGAEHRDVGFMPRALA